MDDIKEKDAQLTKQQVILDETIKQHKLLMDQYDNENKQLKRRKRPSKSRHKKQDLKRRI